MQNRIVNKLLTFGDHLLRDGVHYTVGNLFYRLCMHHPCCHGWAKGVSIGAEGGVLIEHGVPDGKVDCVGMDEVRSTGLLLPHAMIVWAAPEY